MLYNLRGIGVLLNDALMHGQEELGFKPSTLQLVDDPLNYNSIRVRRVHFKFSLAQQPNNDFCVKIESMGYIGNEEKYS